MITKEELLKEINTRKTVFLPETQQRVEEEISLIDKNDQWDLVATLIEMNSVAKQNCCPFEINPFSSICFSAIMLVMGASSFPDISSSQCGFSLSLFPQAIFPNRSRIFTSTSNKGEKLMNDILKGSPYEESIDIISNRTIGRLSRLVEYINSIYPGKLDIKNLPLDDELTFSTINDIDWHGATDKHIDTFMVEAVKRIKPQTLRDLSIALHLAFRRQNLSADPSETNDEMMAYMFPTALSFYMMSYIKTHFREEFYIILEKENEKI